MPTVDGFGGAGGLWSGVMLSEGTVRAYGRWLTQVLRTVVEAPDTPVGAIGTLPADERAAMLELGDVPLRGAYGPLLQEFGTHVAATPDHPAVVCEDRQLTYRELDEAANRLARRLHADGVVVQGTFGPLGDLETRLEQVVEETRTADVVGVRRLLRARRHQRDDCQHHTADDQRHPPSTTDPHLTPACRRPDPEPVGHAAPQP